MHRVLFEFFLLSCSSENSFMCIMTGIASSELSILERHLTYSLSHEKTSTRLYIMKYERALNEEFTEFAIKDLIRRFIYMFMMSLCVCVITVITVFLMSTVP